MALFSTTGFVFHVLPLTHQIRSDFITTITYLVRLSDKNNTLSYSCLVLRKKNKRDILVI